MDNSEFFDGMKYLFALFGKPAPKSEIVNAWFDQFDKDATLENFRSACSKLATQMDRLPALSVVLQAMPGYKHQEHIHDSCPHCAAGTIRFEFFDHGYSRVYERIAACDCASGNRRTNVTYGGRKMKRYSSMYPIHTAHNGG